MSKTEFGLQCPSCGKANEFKPSVKMACGACEKSMLGHSFVKKKIRLPTTMVALTAAIMGAKVVHERTEERLPYEAEYRLMQACVNGDHDVRTRSLIFKKVEVCGCMIEEAIDRIGVERDRDEPDEVVAAFGAYMNQAYGKCS